MLIGRARGFDQNWICVYRQTDGVGVDAAEKGIGEALADLEQKETKYNGDLEERLLRKIDPISPDRPKALNKKYR